MAKTMSERTPRNLIIGIAMTLLGGVLWGMNATVSKLLMADYHVSPLWIACVRELGAGAIFVICSAVMTPKQLVGIVRDRKSYPRLLAIALICVLLVQVSYLFAIDWTNSGTATVLQSLNLLFVLGFVCIRGRRLPGRREAVGVALAFVGTVLIATGGNLSTLKLPLIGLIWGLVDAASTAAMSIMPTKLIAKWGNFTVNGIAFLISGIVLRRHCAAACGSSLGHGAAIGLGGHRPDDLHCGRRHIRRVLAVHGRRDARGVDAGDDARHQRAGHGDRLRRGVDRRGVHLHRSCRFRDDSHHGVFGALNALNVVVPQSGCPTALQLEIRRVFGFWSARFSIVDDSVQTMPVSSRGAPSCIGRQLLLHVDYVVRSAMGRLSWHVCVKCPQKR